MTDRALQKMEAFWSHYDEVDPSDEDTDWTTNIQVSLSREHPGHFTVFAASKETGEVVVHKLDQEALFSLADWIKSGGR